MERDPETNESVPRTYIQDYEIKEIPARHPSIFEPRTLVFGAILGLLGVVIGLELLTRVGITPNTSIIAAIVAIAVSRIPIGFCRIFRSLTRQNLLQTVISAATFGSANALLMPLGILWLLGEMDLLPAMMVGAFLGLAIDATILYRVFDSKIYPAEGFWPPGVATAECLIAGDRGGKRGRYLGAGLLCGILGRLFGIPMDVAGVCWIGNIWALTMFAVGLLLRGYSLELWAVDLSQHYVPQGVMIGAGIIAIIQIGLAIGKRESSATEGADYRTTGRQLGIALGGGFFAFAGAAVLMAGMAGFFARMPALMLLKFVFFAAVAALVSEVIVGISAMHAGWFPTFATTLIFLVLGMMLGFPRLPLAFLVGFTASTGPAFADLGYDFKTGWILRGRGKHPEFERQGRQEQYRAALLGFAIAAVAVWLSYDAYFAKDLLPPVDRVFAATIQAGTKPEVAHLLFLWAIPGGIIQLLGGPTRQIGILLATGLLIHNPLAGWTALASLAVRVMILRKFGEPVRSPMYVLAGGFIAGSALTSFGTATLKLR